MSAKVADIHKLFDRLRILSSDGWTPMSTVSSDGTSTDLAKKVVSPCCTLVRAQHDVDVPFDKLKRMYHPQIWFHPGQAAFDDELLACGVERVNAPGDVLTWLSIRDSSMYRRASSFFAAAFGKAGAGYEGSADAEAATADAEATNSVRFRVVLRRDFPAEGQCAIAMAPRDPESDELLEEFGHYKATLLLLEPRGNASRLTSLKRLPRIPEWTLPLVAPAYGSLVHWHFSRNQRRMESFHDDTGVFEAAWERDAGYVVVGIKKCARGPPLLPNLQGNEDVSRCSDWAAPNFVPIIDLPRYLREFLVRLGVEAEVYDSLEGRSLVPYQAALQRATWDRVWEELAMPWKQQRSEYRRLYGGAQAPQMAVDCAPRFKEDQYSLIGDEIRSVVPVQRTFVHFGAEDGPCKQQTVDDACALQRRVAVY